MWQNFIRYKFNNLTINWFVQNDFQSTIFIYTFWCTTLQIIANCLRNEIRNIFFISIYKKSLDFDFCFRTHFWFLHPFRLRFASHSISRHFLLQGSIAVQFITRSICIYSHPSWPLGLWTTMLVYYEILPQTVKSFKKLRFFSLKTKKFFMNFFKQLEWMRSIISFIQNKVVNYKKCILCSVLKKSKRKNIATNYKNNENEKKNLLVYKNMLEFAESTKNSFLWNCFVFFRWNYSFKEW